MKLWNRLLILCGLLIGLFVITACQRREQSHVEVDLALGYIPNVQFAPFYVAMEKGFFEEEGLSINLIYGYEVDGVSLVGAGEYQFAVASGEQVLLANEKELPVVYVMNWYEKYPVGITVLNESNIKTIADLKNRTIGTPALQGASYIGMQALLDIGGIVNDDVTVEVIGYSQVEMLRARKVDAVVVYLANEPVQLNAEGYEITSFSVSDHVDLIGNGIVSNRATIENNPALVKKLIRGTLRGMRYAAENPIEAYRICGNYVENLPSNEDSQQYEVLKKSIEFWSFDQTGFSSLEAWNNTETLLRRMNLISKPVDVSELFTNDYLPSVDGSTIEK